MRFSVFSKRSSTLALALALGMGGVLSVTALEAPAAAQKKKKDDDKAAKPQYSKGFVAAYNPVQQLDKDGDVEAVKAALPGVIAAVENDDDRNVAGSLVYATGSKLSDTALRRQGLDMMLQSGKVPAESQPGYYLQAGQLAYQDEDWSAARTYFERAMELGYTENDLTPSIAETYFQEERFADGVTYLSQAIEAKRQAGQPVDEAWIRRGLAMAYNNQLDAQAREYSSMYVRDYPSATSWGDAIGILYNTSEIGGEDSLDLLRLARRVDGLRQSNQYLEYIDQADPRKLPGEVVAVIDEGYASGNLDRSNTFVSEARAEAAKRVKTDETELPELAKDARAANANLVTVMAAGNAFLSYGRAADAEEFFAKAATMPGANTPLVLTRMGIAQLDQGKYAEAEATFNRVEGARQAIANLWAIYTTQQAGS
ncbi:hypothetical protein [Erythrobacter sp. A6_0]|uniref:hypothetical protein n=1 Tax=Erythrobacter sp. A6_0 TaxID=2821089 RepID=UPI001ADBA1B4|nr:hypothetical protein [Erythrobacter sp. A6_0]MBO9510565.1 hypothetical protein [Erythrobacter sp. A6_0]|tara:strand:+ start:557 stop:1837 length:1281 start_codon:yes stop_codon:yes gene_type:complete